MKYIYTKEMCSACHDLKKHYKELGIEYEEREADRITNPQDDIDKDMFIKIAQEGKSLNPIELPVEIDI